MSKRIERVEEVLVYSEPTNPWLKLYFDKVTFPDGRAGRYNRVVESDGRDGVAILPLNGHLVGLVRQFRYPVNEVVWEIPRGFADGPEARAEAARELSEETGVNVNPSELISLGTIHPNTGLLESTVHLFAANCVKLKAGHRPSDGEVEEFSWFDPQRIGSMIQRQEIRDAFTLSALCRAAYLGVRPIGLEGDVTT